jgi:hypothetical protein
MNILPLELFGIILKDEKLKIKRLINKSIKQLFDTQFISCMHYISENHLLNYNQSYAIYSPSGFTIYDIKHSKKSDESHIFDDNCILIHTYYENKNHFTHIYAGVDLLTLSNILKTRQYPNLPKDYVKNVLKIQIQKRHLMLYNYNPLIYNQYYLYNWLYMNAYMFNLYKLPYIDDQKFNFKSLNKQLYKMLKDYIDNL